MTECPRKNFSSSSLNNSCTAGVINSSNAMDTDLDGQATPIELSRDRVASSIPRSDAESSTTWQYPSPQMFYSAMQRKGHLAHRNISNAKDMEVIVNIHNIVNEQTWQEILKWERRHQSSPQIGPKLKRFLGRPGEWTPRAWWRHYILGYVAPFDRHDWFIERSDGKVVRYVIDFYQGHQTSNKPTSLYIDARPALDSWSALYNRFTRCLEGIPQQFPFLNHMNRVNQSE